MLWKHRAKWRLVGIQLQIEPKYLESIAENNRTVEDALLEVIKLWLRRKNPKPTRTLLTAAIQSKVLHSEAESQLVAKGALGQEG